MSPGTEVSYAKDILFRRELNKVGSDLKYQKKDWIELKESRASHLCEVILYAAMAPNLNIVEPAMLAALAIESARNPKNHGIKRRDGIRYLYDIKDLGIRTPLMGEYEKQILKQLNVESLEEALEITSQS